MFLYFLNLFYLYFYPFFSPFFFFFLTFFLFLLLLTGSEAIPTRPLKSSDGSGSSSPGQASSGPNSPSSLARKEERDRERRRSVGGELVSDRKERVERDGIASEHASPNQGSKSKLTVQEKRNMLKQQLAAGV